MTQQTRKYSIAGCLQRTVFVVVDRYYATRQEAQRAVDALIEAGYLNANGPSTFPEIQEYQIDR